MNNGSKYARKKISYVARWLLYQIHTLFLFTCSDFKTIVVPSTIFGFFNSLAAGAYGLGANTPFSTDILLNRLPRTLLWVSLVFIPFSINNQRTPSAIQEDEINKPWRPIPQRRITPLQAQCVMWGFAALVQIHGLISNGIGHRQSTFLLVLDIWYNNFGGADNNPAIRNGINALGYLCFISGALEVALWEILPFPFQNPLGKTRPEFQLMQWLLIIAGIIFTTVHLQDLYDQKGDAVRDRHTMPLVFGDGPARWTIAVPMIVWGAVCPLFWKVSTGLFRFSLTLAYIVAVRVLTIRDEAGDRATFRVWNCWIATIYIMPLFSHLS
ncbi:hypothetical protein N7466_003542 [Penicillium verhagenii]|uniref:uncharacterized protein n=1 Tax=Penicillium verhagenii TaxID=1562060 RepID=UPI0025459509|nr:uncharacterized protein N7466_003542 [Penicillium verhagenii]KAJ5937092.1 hypothetical protein N7466_003542 [Penicillium verhagenii]